MSSREYESREAVQSRNNESSNSFLIGAIIGGLAGAAAALLLAPQSGKEIRRRLSHQAGMLLDKTDQWCEKGTGLVTKTTSISQGLKQQSEGLKKRLMGNNTDQVKNTEESDLSYIPLHTPDQQPEGRKSIELKAMDPDEIRKKLVEAEQAFDEEESRIKLY